jgi:hypothetical protein
MCYGVDEGDGDVASPPLLADVLVSVDPPEAAPVSAGAAALGFALALIALIF